MKLNLENGLPVWVWAIVFVLLVLLFSFRGVEHAPQESPPPAIFEPTGAPITPHTAEPQINEPTARPLPPVDPNATKPTVIDVSG